MTAQKTADRYELLYQISDAMTSTLEPREVLELILREAVSLLEATSGSVILLDEHDPDCLIIEVSYNLDPDVVQQTRLRLGQGVTGRAAQMGLPIAVPEVEKDPDYVEIDSRIRSEIAVPLKLADQVIGVLNLDSTRPSAFSEKDFEILVPLANHAAKVIQNARLYDSVRQKAEVLRILQSINQSITASLELKEVLERIVQGAAHLLQAKLASIFLLAENREHLHLTTYHGHRTRYRQHPELPVHGSLLGQVILRQEPIYAPDVLLEPMFQLKKMAKSENLKTLYAVPLPLEGEVIGVLAVYFDRVRPRVESEIDLLSSLALQSSSAIHNARLHERVMSMEEQIHALDRLSVAGETAASLAHEIRNPLAVINLLISSFEEDLLTGDPRRKDLEVIRDNINHVHSLMEDLLNLARCRTSIPQPTDLALILESALSLLGPKISRQQIKVQKNLAPDLPKAMVDPGRMQQVLFNLLQNAIEAIGTRGEITLTLRAGEEQGKLTLVIHDNGPGISAEALRRLYEPFNTTKERGVGLGLSIVKRIVQEHGGTITVSSSMSKGTAFTITIPTATAEVAGESEKALEGSIRTAGETP